MIRKLDFTLVFEDDATVAFKALATRLMIEAMYRVGADMDIELERHVTFSSARTITATTRPTKAAFDAARGK